MKDIIIVIFLWWQLIFDQQKLTYSLRKTYIICYMFYWWIRNAFKEWWTLPLINRIGSKLLKWNINRFHIWYKSNFWYLHNVWSFHLWYFDSSAEKSNLKCIRNHLSHQSCSNTVQMPLQSFQKGWWMNFRKECFSCFIAFLKQAVLSFY